MVPTVAIVGRPNVGKSTLFNRLVGRRQSIVHDLPGVTRDRITARVELDDARPIELIDTGGLVLGDDPLGLSAQVLLAVEESDLLLFVVDGKDGPTTADQAVWERFRPYGKKALLVVNKADVRIAREGAAEFHRLGLGEPILVSAEHSLGIFDLKSSMLETLPVPNLATEKDETPAIAIVGRPNVGKSSLINRLLGEERVLVSPVAGTTRDPIDSHFAWGGRDYKLIDTAGIRRRSQVTGVAEEIAVLFARRQMDQAQVVVLVIDATLGVTTGDLAIGGEAWELGRPLVVAINKWDLLDEIGRERLDASWPRLAALFADPSRVNLSALSGRHIEKLMPAVQGTLERSRLQLGTSELNRLFEHITEGHPPPTHKGQAWKFYYVTQVANAPPTFMVFANRTIERGSSYRRFLENRLREALDIEGVPIRLVIRRREH
jgi:GTPase